MAHRISGRLKERFARLLVYGHTQNDAYRLAITDRETINYQSAGERLASDPLVKKLVKRFEKEAERLTTLRIWDGSPQTLELINEKIVRAIELCAQEIPQYNKDGSFSHFDANNMTMLHKFVETAGKPNALFPSTADVRLTRGDAFDEAQGDPDAMRELVNQVGNKILESRVIEAEAKELPAGESGRSIEDMVEDRGRNGSFPLSTVPKAERVS